jgi:hypothetical protein
LYFAIHPGAALLDQRVVEHLHRFQRRVELRGHRRVLGLAPLQRILAIGLGIVVAIERPQPRQHLQQRIVERLGLGIERAQCARQRPRRLQLALGSFDPALADRDIVGGRPAGDLFPFILVRRARQAERVDQGVIGSV